VVVKSSLSVSVGPSLICLLRGASGDNLIAMSQCRDPDMFARSYSLLLESTAYTGSLAGNTEGGILKAPRGSGSKTGAERQQR
jgi:hypothetical protein